jgi:DNA repair protein RecN (Recombination protein N)
MISYRNEIAGFLESEDSANVELNQLESDLADAAVQLTEAAESLLQARRTGALKLEQQLVRTLRQLGMEGARIEVEFYPCETGIPVTINGEQRRLGEAGPELGQFRFSANVGEEPRPLARIASGGEISRVMLALKSMISGSDRVDLLVFDEIDVGIGGATAALVGKHLKQLAKRQQVIAITHLQQIAAHADHHYRASKVQQRGRTESRLELLDDAERVEELGRMIYGGNLGEEERRQAEKLLAASGRKVSVDRGRR